MRLCIFPTSGSCQRLGIMYHGLMKTLTAQQAIQALIANGYTQNDIAKAASVDQTTVSRILRGVAPNVLLSTSERIIKAHNLTLTAPTTDKREA